MLGPVLNYAVHYPGRLAYALARNPIDLWDKFHDRLVQQWEYRIPVHRYEPSPQWERDLHRWLGIGGSRKAQFDFCALWPEVIDSVRQLGIDVGPESFAGFNDGDRALARALWCITRHLKCSLIIETGV